MASECDGQCSDAMDITSPRSIDEEEAGGDQRDRQRESWSKRFAKDEVTGGHSKKRRQKGENRQARGRITHDQHKPVVNVMLTT